MTPKKTSPPAAALPYFRPDALAFLRNLAKHNDRAWFQPRKAQFEAELREPILAIVRKITDAMADFVATIRQETKTTADYRSRLEERLARIEAMLATGATGAAGQ